MGALYVIWTKHGLIKITQKSAFNRIHQFLRATEAVHRALRYISKKGFTADSTWILLRSLPQMQDSDYHWQVNDDNFKDWCVNNF
jgi:hypothetical protein